jgi:hypothetical protein
MVLIPILLIAIGVALWYRRMHLMVRHPDKYQQYHEKEKKFAKVQVEATERTAKGLLAALRGAMRWLGKRLRKDRTPSMLEDREWN